MCSKSEITVVISLFFIFNRKNIPTKEYFYLSKYVSGEFGTGDGPEFSNDPKYADAGKYIPEIVDIKDIENITLLPEDIRDRFIEDFKNIF